MNEPGFLDPLIGGPGFKGFPHHAAPLRRSAIGAQRWNLLRGDLPLPLAVIKRDALAGNLRWMQQFAREQGVDMAPHGKTTHVAAAVCRSSCSRSLGPDLRQRDAGACRPGQLACAAA